MKSDHDAHLALAQRTTWNTSRQADLDKLAPRKPTSPRRVWDDELQVVSRNELRLAIGLGLAGLLVGLTGTLFLIFG